MGPTGNKNALFSDKPVFKIFTEDPLAVHLNTGLNFRKHSKISGIATLFFIVLTEIIYECRWQN